GQRAGSTIKLGFEGGQMALIRRLPKLGFTNAPHKKQIVEINLSHLEKHFSEEELVSLVNLKQKKMVSKTSNYVKILFKGQLSKKIQIDKSILMTSKAKKEILAKGGTVA
ncbi:MAG: 50S ribosomal protein L15, partial [Alphaproteobacteria bacterium]|nr:50S ribosomal protein L15 [Alphaproteobacteria bacterium]